MNDLVEEPQTVSSTRALAPDEQQIIVSRLQRSGAAIAACECGSRSWLPPHAVNDLFGSAPWPSNGAARKLVVSITCAACGLIKLYDPAVVGALPDNL
jgi:hypothetical protein